MYSQLFLILFIISNLVFYLNAQYRGEGPSTATLKNSIELKCVYSGADGNGQFTEWFKDGVRINSEKPGHYVVRQNEKESILIIKIFVNADAEVANWYVETNNHAERQPANCQFRKIILKSSPQSIKTDRASEIIDTAAGSLRRNEGEQITLKCVILPESHVGNQVQWRFSQDGKDFDRLPDQVIIQRNDDLVIEQIKKNHRGFYRCTLNDASFTVLLRVKDRFAALWPFLGIVSVVLVLVIIILIFEKRQKTNKKSVPVDDDEQDQTQDLITRTTTKGSDNDAKKRSVKA
jgi:hypothetical protein